jgi:2-polyprenyl-3-methyl-5-hydroxy-6-metoxy-1,4-benzoquinol methylase
LNSCTRLIVTGETHIVQKNNLSSEINNDFRNCPNCGHEKYRIRYREGNFVIVQCKNCALVYLANPPDESTLYEEYYEDIVYKAADYSRDSGDIRLSTLFTINEQRLGFMKKEKKQGELLDIGCGLGFFMKSARDKGYAVSGIDTSSRATEYAQKEFGLSAKNETLTDVIQKGSKFDIITLWHVLEHYLNPRNRLVEIHQLLKDDGICFVEVPNLNSLKFKLSRQKWSGGNHPKYHRSFFSFKTLEATLKQAGFSSVRRIYISYKTGQTPFIYHDFKQLLNRVNMDSFLIYSARKAAAKTVL